MEENDTELRMNTRRPWYKLITIEPVLFFYMMAFMVTNVIEQTFYVFRTCNINHGLSEEICHNLNKYENYNQEVQVTLAIFHQWNGIAGHIVPFFLVFFLGSWSDKRGRKSIILAGLIGKLFFSVMITIITLTDWPVEYVIYFATFPSALTGADLAIFTGSFAYISDMTTIENRTFRIGIVDAVYLSTMPIGVALGNLIYNNLVNKSFTAMFAINTTLMVIATVYCLFFLKWQSRVGQRSLREDGVRNPIKDFFDVNNIKSSITTLVKKRPSNRRMFLWFLLLSMGLYTFQRDERPVMYLYTTSVFKWDATQFSHFRTYLSAVYVLTMLVGIPVMTRLFKWQDTVIVLLGATAHMCGHLIYALATTSKHMYIGATAAALGPIVAPLIRSMTSKVLASAERGVAYAFLSVMENLVGLFASIIYSQLYKATLQTDHINAIFYLTLGTQAIVFLLILCIHLILLCRGQKLEPYVEQEEDYKCSS